MPQKDIPCSVVWCGLPSAAKELCSQHYSQFQSHSLSWDHYVEVMSASSGECGNPGCDGEERLSLDHDHEICEGRKVCEKCFRGVLCGRCNGALGMLNDDEDRIRGLWFYINNMI